MSTNKDLEKQLEYFESEIIEAYENDGLWEYLMDLDIYNCDFTIRLGSRGLEYSSVRVMLACGGPNIYLDTDEGALIGAWGSDREELYLDSDIIEQIDDYFEDYYSNCI